jgi:hypothetical protein
MKHELVLLAGKIEWQWIDSEIAPLYSDKGRPGIEAAARGDQGIEPDGQQACCAAAAIQDQPN